MEEGKANLQGCRDIGNHNNLRSAKKGPKPHVGPCLVSGCERDSTKRHGKYCSSSCKKKPGPWKKGPSVSTAKVVAHQAPDANDLSALYHVEPPNDDGAMHSLFIESLPDCAPAELFEGVNAEDMWRTLLPNCGATRTEFQFKPGDTVGAVKQRLAMQLQLDPLSLRVFVDGHEQLDDERFVTTELISSVDLGACTAASAEGSSMEYAELAAADFVMVGGAPNDAVSDASAQCTLAGMQQQIQAMQQQMQRQQEIIADQQSELSRSSSNMAKMHFETDKKNRTTIQRAYRRFISRRQEWKHSSSIDIQSAVRRFVAVRRCHHVRSSASISIQAIYRARVVRADIASKVREI
jgi:hypothetical protein